jgi:hypothetical protein
MILLLFNSVATPQERFADFERSRIELTSSYRLLNVSGTIQSGTAPIELESDLGIEQRKFTSVGKLVYKPSRKHRIVVEGVPYLVQGTNDLARTVTFRGRTYVAQDRIFSELDLLYISGGYQYDVISRPQGHFGIQGTAVYLDVEGSIRSLRTDRSVTRSGKIGIPLAGAEFRVFPISGSNRISVSGELKGMSFGRFGRFVQTGAHFGVQVGPVTLQAGYTLLDADVHNAKSEPTAINVRFRGPAFSIEFRDR